MDNPSINQNVNLNTGFLPKRAALYLGVLAFALVLLLFLGAGQASAEDVSGDIAVDTTWTSGNVYNMTGSVTILSNATLTIQNNVTIVAETYCVIWVEGELVVQGTADLPVIFTYNETVTPTQGLWYGIYFEDGSTGSVNFANFTSTWTAMYFENVSIPVSNININTTMWGMAWSFYGVEQNIALSLTDISIRNGGHGNPDGFEIWNSNGSLDLTFERVSMDNLESIADIRATTAAGTGAMTLSITDSQFNNTDYGIQILTDNFGDIELIDSEFTNIDDYVLWLTDDSGDKVITLDGVTIDDCYGGIYAFVEFGNVDMTITDSMLSGEDVLVDITVNSNMLTNGFVTLSVTGSQFSEAGLGIRTWSEELVLLAMTDNEFVNITGAALHFTVRTATSTDDVLALAFTDVTMVNVGTGLFAYINDASLDLDLVGVHFDTNMYGVNVEVSSVLPEEMSTIDMVITDSVIEGGMYGVFATSVNGGNVMISGSEFLGQSEISYNFDSVYGEVDVEIVDSVFDGSSSESANTLYMVEEIDHEFELYGRQSDSWAEVFDDGSTHSVDLPFTFDYDGVGHTSVDLSPDGGLRFGSHSSIRPVGPADLSYDGYHFFGYKVAEDESYVLFNWYAYFDYSGEGESNSFQVILYANGDIQFNYAAMDGYGDDNHWGLLMNSGLVWDYNMYQLMGTQAWNMDYTSFLFTSHDISMGMGIMVRSEAGDVDFVLNNNTVTSYYAGGVYAQASDGDMVFSATENMVSYMYASSDIYGPTGVIVARAFNGTINANIVNNTFFRLWSPAVFATAVDYVGGEHSFEVTGNEFIKTHYGVYTYVDIYDAIWDAPVSDSLSVVANFQNNTMTDSFGLANGVYVYTSDEINWNISVEQTFAGNVMAQEWYEGSFPLYDYMGYPGSMIMADLYVDDYQADVATSLTVSHMVSITDNEIEQAVSGGYGIIVGSDLYKAMGDIDSVCSMSITDDILSVWGWYGIEAWTSVEAAFGTVNSETSVVIEDNQITDTAWETTAISVFVEGESEWGEAMAVDMNAIAFVSITGNVIEGAYEGINVYMEYDQDNTVGDWNISATAHIDGNQLTNVTYGVCAQIYGGVEFDENYWPYYDEVAIGNFVMDYLLTIDDNIVSSMWGEEYGTSDAIIYVEAGYWAEVNPSTHFTEAYATVTGEISVSDNEVTQEGGDLTLLYLYEGYGAVKTGVMDVTVDIAVEDNLFVYDEYGGSNTGFAVFLEDYVYLGGNFDIDTDQPVVMADVSWSVTGNNISGSMDVGIALTQETDISSPDCDLVQNFSADISENTIDGAMEAGLGYLLTRDEETNGYVELNIDLNIEDNTLIMAGAYMTIQPMQTSGITFAFGEYPANGEDDVEGLVVNIDVLISGNTISGAEVGMSLAHTFEDDNYLAPDYVYVYEVNFLVENNHIDNSYYGILAYGGNMTLRNNVIEDSEYGIGWDYANGEIVGNTITAMYGIEIYNPYVVLVQNNVVTYVGEGVYISGWDGDYTDVQILDNTLTCSEAMDECYGYGNGVVLYESGNVLISGNAINDSYWGVYVDGCYDLTVSDNLIIGSMGTGVEMYWVFMGWIESNVVSYGGGDGVIVGDGCIDIVIGNNTIANNLDDGVEISESEEESFSIHSITLYNNEIIDNGDEGVDDDAYDSELIWYVDADCKVARNDVDLDSDIIVLAGGSMMVEDVHEFDVDSLMLVNEGGLFSASNTNFYGDGDIDVHGAFWANVCLFDGLNIYLGPTSEAEIRGGAIMFYDYAGVHVDGCAPVIADNLIFSPYAKFGILIEGEGAAPSIVSNIIALNDQGVYARGTDMGGVYDNLIILNVQSGILADNATGKIHDNILLANKIEILLRNSNVSVEDNEIGYTNLIQVLANYAPLLGHLTNISIGMSEVTSDEPLATLGSVLGIEDFDPYDLATWVKGHNGIWAEDSVVRTSGNVYGILNYALYSVRSEIHFADDVETIELVIPHVIEGVTYNYSLNIYVMNGIFASGSQVWVDGSTIEVLDDGLMLDNSDAWVEGATLVAGDFDYFLYNGAEVYNIATTYGKAKIEDSHSLNEGTWLTLHAVDEGDPAANVSVVIKNAKGDTVYQGVTDAEGKIEVLLIQYSITSEGKDDGFNPYTIDAAFESGDESMELTLNESYMDVTIEGEEEFDMGALLAVIGVLVIILLIVAAVVVMRRRK